jgi:hypothetical protein
LFNAYALVKACREVVQIVSLSLEPVEKAVKRGTSPRFHLTIRNEGNNAEQVIDLCGGRRADLQDTYYDLEVTQGGKTVDIPRIISDPGPIGEKDFVILKPGEVVTFELSRFATSLESLLPGKYQARVRFWQDSLKSFRTSFFGPAAEFVVHE